MESALTNDVLPLSTWPMTPIFRLRGGGSSSASFSFLPMVSCPAEGSGAAVSSLARSDGAPFAVKWSRNRRSAAFAATVLAVGSRGAEMRRGFVFATPRSDDQRVAQCSESTAPMRGSWIRSQCPVRACPQMRKAKPVLMVSRFSSARANERSCGSREVVLCRCSHHSAD